MTTLTFKSVVYVILIQICLTHPVNKIVSSPTSSINCIYNNETNAIIECYKITIITDFNNSINYTNHNITVINNDELTPKQTHVFIILGCLIFISFVLMCYLDNYTKYRCLTKI